jgi:hypothetical protein
VSTLAAPLEHARPAVEEDDEPVHIANPLTETPVALCGEPLTGDILVDAPDEDDICPLCMRVVRHMGWRI